MKNDIFGLMNAAKGIIFELEGVLVSIGRIHFLAWEKAADKLDLNFDKELFARLKGASKQESIDIILRSNSVIFGEEKKQLFSRLKSEYYKKLLNRLRASDFSQDVRLALLELRLRGYLLAVGSSGKHAKFMLEKVGFSNFFDAVTDGHSLLNESASRAEVYLNAAAALKLPPYECMVILDDDTGLTDAKNGGFVTVKIGPADKPSDYDLVISKVSDLLEPYSKQLKKTY